MTRIYKYDVFISHSRTNGHFARTLAGRLRDLDFSVWIPRRLALQGSNRMIKAMEDSAVCVLLFSNDGESPWTDKAIWSAITNRIYRSDGKFRVIPILFQDTQELESADLITKLTGYWSNPLQQSGSFVRFERTVTEDAVKHLVLRIRGVKDSEPSWKETLKDEVKLRARHLLSVDWLNWADTFGQNSLRSEFKRQMQLDPDPVPASQSARLPLKELLLEEQVQPGRDLSYRSARLRLDESRQHEWVRDFLRLSRIRNNDLLDGSEDRNSFLSEWVENDQLKIIDIFGRHWSTYCDVLQSHDSTLGLYGEAQSYFRALSKLETCDSRYLFPSFVRDVLICCHDGSHWGGAESTMNGMVVIPVCYHHAVRESHLIGWEPLNCGVGDRAPVDIVDSCDGSIAPRTKYKSKMVNENRGSDGARAYSANKIIVDMGGGYAPQHGLWGKDPTTVDRSAAYMARYIARNIVAAGLTDKCEVQLAYAIGVAKPVSVYVNTCESGRIGEVQTSDLVRKDFPGMIMGIGGLTGAIASLGDRIKVSVKKAAPDGATKKGTVKDAVIVRTRKEVRRRDGTYIRFDQNAAVLIKEDGTPIGTRVFGPVARELRDRNYMKIVSLAPDSNADSFDSIEERLSHFLGLCTGEKIDQLPS